MPSTTKKQAMLMSAIDHGWHPAHPRHNLPSRAVAHEFHEADKEEGKFMHADGGEVESALEQFTGSPMHSGRPMMHGPNIGYLTHMKMPYVPIAGITHNVFAHLKGVSERLPKLQAKVGKMPTYRYKYDVGGEVRLGADAIAAIKDAISHIANRDASSASAALTTNRAAMAHPVVQQAAQALRRGQGIGQAAQALTGLVNADTERTVMPTFRRGGPTDPRRGRR